MKNAYAISSLSQQMVKVCEQIDSLAMGVQDTEQGIGDLGDTYQNLLLDELEHIQMLTLKLTELVSEAVGRRLPTPTKKVMVAPLPRATSTPRRTARKVR